MRILYVAMRYDYGRPDQGESFEHWNFYDSLSRMGHEILYFDFPSLIAQLGRDGMNAHLIETVRLERPELMFSVLFRDEFDRATIRTISNETGTTTVNWFCDDVWRFDDFTKIWAPCFNWSVTTATSALPQYAKIGVGNVIKSQWACNPHIYRRLPRPAEPRYDVSFIGQPHGVRREIVRALRDEGLRVEAWGQGWENGRIAQDGMIDVFNDSRINLNLANASQPPAGIGERTRERAIALAASTLRSIPGTGPIREFGRRVLYGHRGEAGDPAAADTPATPPELTANPGRSLDELDAWCRSATPSQMKGRNFEVPGCGGFLLTDPAVELSECYVPGREVVVFESIRDLIEKSRFYMRHDDERRAIAEAGYQRTLREHTYEHRFNDIFRVIFGERSRERR